MDYYVNHFSAQKKKVTRHKVVRSCTQNSFRFKSTNRERVKVNPKRRNISGQQQRIHTVRNDLHANLRVKNCNEENNKKKKYNRLSYISSPNACSVRSSSSTFARREAPCGGAQQSPTYRRRRHAKTRATLRLRVQTVASYTFTTFNDTAAHMHIFLACSIGNGCDVTSEAWCSSYGGRFLEISQ